uniref:DNA-directed RNA polymerase n=1 Tax=Solanum lycopersicum TaxID=4081 RepID=K4DE50_SOLLC
MCGLDNMNHLKNKRMCSIVDLLQDQFRFPLVCLETVVWGLYVEQFGLTGRTASFWVRDIHPSHYGRFFPIDISEGINVGLIGSLSIHARTSHWGSLESPFYRVLKRSIREEQVDPSRYRQEFMTIAWERFPQSFIERNDLNQDLMSSNMKCQEVPLSRSEKCIVGTRLE